MIDSSQSTDSPAKSESRTLLHRVSGVWLSRAGWVLFVLAVTFPLVLLASSRATARFRNEITEWANPATEASQRFTDFRNWFGPNEYVLLTWPGSSRDDATLARVEQVLGENRLGGLIDSVSSGRSVYAALRDRGRVDESTIRQRLQGTILGKDGSRTGIAFNLSEAGRMRRDVVFQKLDGVLTDAGIDTDQVQFAGLGHDLHVLDDEGFRSPFRMVPAIMIVALLLTWVFVRDWRLACFINALGTYSGCVSFTLIYFTDINLNAIVWPLPTLLMLLTVSACLHFLSYYRSARSSVGETGAAHGKAVADAVAHVFRPVLFCSLTTGAGLFSLCLSNTRPVREFGLFGGMSVLLASVITVVGLSSWLKIFPARWPAADTKHGGFWSWLARWTTRFRVPIIVVMIGGMAVLGAGVTGIGTGGNLRNFFPASHSIIKDAASIESDIGPLSSVELLLKFENPSRANDFERIRLIGDLCDQLRERTPVSAAVSGQTFAPRWIPDATGLALSREFGKLNTLRNTLSRYSLLHVDEDSDFEVWRVSLRYSGLATVNVPVLQRDVENLAREMFYEDEQLVFPDERMTVLPTGEFVLFDFVDRQFLRDLAVTYSTAFVLISLVVFGLLRSARAMGLASFPNVFPALVVLGVAGWLELSLDVASLMTASVALGIAVDDTLHFVLWWRERIDAGDAPVDAIEHTMRHCGSAMVQTSVSCGLSIGLYAFCGFLPTVRFGLLLASMLMMALMGDLILLPALLSGGKVKEPDPEAGS